MSISKIVITGGPCAGKTTAMSRVVSEFSDMGYQVLCVPETATELIQGGISPVTCGTAEAFQKFLLKLQMEKERVFERAAQIMDAGKILIICDRGAMDNKAYMDADAFQSCLDFLETNEVELWGHYDAVFHLATAAKGAEEWYTTENNSARTESIEEAVALDDRLISAWTGHPHLRVIENGVDFETKQKKLIKEIATFLGEPEPLEIERKFLIQYPDIDWLEQNPDCQRIEIIQTYLNTNPDNEVRVRQRGINGSYVYFKTTKRAISDIKRVEIEQRLTEKEYLALLMEANTAKHQIRKTRYCLTYKNQYFEIDVYPFWNDKAIVELELGEEDQEIHFPEQLRIIKEVTDDDAYKNVNLADDHADKEKAEEPDSIRVFVEPVSKNTSVGK